MAIVWKRRPVKDASRLAWARITLGAIDRIHQHLAAKFKPATSNRALTALRRTLKECWRAEELTWEQYKRLADFDQVPGDNLPGRAARRSDIEKMLQVCERDSTAAGARDGAAIALLYGAGLRRAEAAALEVRDLLGEGEVAVAGKGGSLSIATTGAAVPWIERWLAVRGAVDGPLLTHVRPGGRVEIEALCGQAVGAIVARRAMQAGVEVTAHALRRAFATELLRCGCDHLLVARALRHRDLRSVKRYDGRSDLERAMAIRSAITFAPPAEVGR